MLRTQQALRFVVRTKTLGLQCYEVCKKRGRSHGTCLGRSRGLLKEHSLWHWKLGAIHYKDEHLERSLRTGSKEWKGRCHPDSRVFRVQSVRAEQGRGQAAEGR